MHWQPGDILVVRPQNSDEQVQELFDIFMEYNFDFGANTIVKLNEIDAGKGKKNFKFYYFYIMIFFYLNESITAQN